ncbi:hypothetical protein [Cedecea sp. USHLN005]|uniref:hypothetical protein n=1 Tax=Cedecea sp. USHLN005 TaxID=3081239 RepID=UPI00301868D9
MNELKLTDKPLSFHEECRGQLFILLSLNTKRPASFHCAGSFDMNELKLTDKPLSFHEECRGQSFILLSLNAKRPANLHLRGVSI